MCKKPRTASTKHHFQWINFPVRWCSKDRWYNGCSSLDVSAAMGQWSPRVTEGFVKAEWNIRSEPPTIVWTFLRKVFDPNFGTSLLCLSQDCCSCDQWSASNQLSSRGAMFGREQMQLKPAPFFPFSSSKPSFGCFYNLGLHESWIMGFPPRNLIKFRWFCCQSGATVDPGNRVPARSTAASQHHNDDTWAQQGAVRVAKTPPDLIRLRIGKKRFRLCGRSKVAQESHYVNATIKVMQLSQRKRTHTHKHNKIYQNNSKHNDTTITTIQHNDTTWYN